MLELFEVGEDIFYFLWTSAIMWRFVFSKTYRIKIKENWDAGDKVEIIAGGFLSVVLNVVIVIAVLYIV